MKRSSGANDLVLTAEDLVWIDQAVPIHAAAGDRYHAQGMTGLDGDRRSEREGV
jgi:hypothetical protein